MSARVSEPANSERSQIFWILVVQEIMTFKNNYRIGRFFLFPFFSLGSSNVHETNHSHTPLVQSKTFSVIQIPLLPSLHLHRTHIHTLTQRQTRPDQNTKRLKYPSRVPLVIALQLCFSTWTGARD